LVATSQKVHILLSFLDYWNEKTFWWNKVGNSIWQYCLSWQDVHLCKKGGYYKKLWHGFGRQHGHLGGKQC
jgi:hypothetical protein